MTKSGPVGTHHIGVDAATNFLHAVRFTAAEDRRLNLAVTINWNRLGISDQDAMTRFRDLRQKVCRSWKHLQKTGRAAVGLFRDVAVHENPSGRRNTHWLAHIPEEDRDAFERVVIKFLRKVAETGDLAGALNFLRVRTAGTFAKYLIKGVDPRYAQYFRVLPVAQGFLEGRGRTFVSRAIGFSARKRAGWRRKADRQVQVSASLGSASPSGNAGPLTDGGLL